MPVSSRSVLVYGTSLAMRGGHNLLALAVITRFAGAEGFGAFALLIATAGLLSPVASLSLEKALVRHLPEARDREERARMWSTVAAAVVAVAALVAAPLVVFAQPLSALLFANVAVGAVLPILAAGLLASAALSGATLEYLRASMRPSGYALLSGAKDIGSLLSLIAAGYWFGTLEAALAGYVAAHMAIAAAGFAFASARDGFAFPDRRILRAFLNFTLPFFLTHPFAWMGKNGHVYLLTLLAGIAALGAYQSAHTLADALSLIGGAFLLPLAPALARLHVGGDAAGVREGMRAGMNLTALVGIPAVAASAVFAYPILALVATEEVARMAAGVMPLLFLAVFLLMLYGVLAEAVVLTKETWWLLAYWVGIAAVLVGLNVVLIPLLGILGSALAELATFALLLGVAYGFARTRLGVTFDLAHFARVAVASAGAAAAALLVPGAAATVLGLLLFGGVYALLALAVGAVRLAEVRTVARELARGRS